MVSYSLAITINSIWSIISSYERKNRCAAIYPEKKVALEYDFVSMWPSQVALVVKNPSANAGDMRDMGLIPGSGRSPEEDHGNPLQYSGLENSMDSVVHEVAKSRTQLIDFHFHIFISLHQVLVTAFGALCGIFLCGGWIL